MLVTNCAEATLAPYVPSPERPWDADRIQHFTRRSGFGAHLTEIEAAVSMGAADFIRRSLDTARDRDARPEPEWAYYNHPQFEAAGIEKFQKFVDIGRWHFEDAQRYGVREKLINFWHDHFAIQYETHSCPSYHWQYWKLLTDYAFGDFKQLCKEMTVTPAMLFFLNGFENRRQSPNENYARELFELFTLGENNGYTQADIEEASRALTGFNGGSGWCGAVRFVNWGFDDTEKTVFGRTGNFNHETLIDVLFEERGERISKFICGKLYRYYVHPVVDEDIVDGLAATFRENDFHVMPVLQQLFASEHFFDDANVGVMIKSPMDMTVGYLRQGHFGDFENRINWSFWANANMGLYFGYPPDVSGWPGNRSWIDSNRLTLRWEVMDGFSWAVHNASESTYPQWARELTGDSRDPEVVTRAIVNYFVPRQLVSEDAYAAATDVFRHDIPGNYYDDGIWNLSWGSVSWQVTLLIRHIARMPEFQLT